MSKVKSLPVETREQKLSALSFLLNDLKDDWQVTVCNDDRKRGMEIFKIRWPCFMGNSIVIFIEQITPPNQVLQATAGTRPAETPKRRTRRA